MKDVLEELKGSISGVIGTFLVSEKGEVAAQSVPELMAGAVGKVAKTLHHVTNVIQATRTVEKITVDSGNAKVISIPTKGRLLVVIADKNINLPLFKLMSNMALSKIEDIPTPVVSKAPAFDVGRVCDLYDSLFGAAAKRLANIIGPKSAEHFTNGAAEVMGSYPDLFDGLHFGTSGKPDMTKIRENATNFSSQDELTDALDELILSMLDMVRSIAGPKQEQKAMDEIESIKRKQGLE